VNLYVNEEISIPNPSPIAVKGYTGTVNDIKLAPNLLRIDRTNSTKDIVHSMLIKPNVLDNAQKIAKVNSKNNNNNNNQNMINEMIFTLSPSQNVVILVL
jgi:hypothetical protein